MDPKDDHAVEEAINYLVLNFLESGDNPKPVVFHSLRVGMRLWSLGHGREVTIAGILHDVLEDTGVTGEELIEEYGPEVHRLVEANSHDRSLEDQEDWYVDVFDRCLEAGREVLAIKAADFYDNLDYYGFGDDRALTLHLLKKARYFIGLSANLISEEQVHVELMEKFDRLLGTKFSDYAQYLE